MKDADKTGTQTSPVLRNHVAIVLDESGSMQCLEQEVVHAFNEQVKTIREESVGQSTTVSLVKFSTTVPNPILWAEPAEAIRFLTPADYCPNGMTAMLDAVGLTISRLNHLEDADDENTSFLVIIVSDGLENNSKKFNWSQIAATIAKLEATGRWTFTYLGANQDLSKVSRDLGLKTDNTAGFTASPKGMQAASERITRGTGKHFGNRRDGLKTTDTFFTPTPEPRKPADSDGAFWNG